ncbi:MAG: putative ABC transporter permease [Clostridia bacterium]|nr:putative ABC transporter permease [Clostridia bacterium]
MWISRYLVEFIFFSFLGWTWETVFCTLKGGKWESRGFLFGPVCPIYGVGATAGVGLVELLRESGCPALSWWQVLLIGFFGSIVLEYFTSWALEKLFHAYWWDYSRMPLNIKGRVCFPASCGFALAGLLVVYVLEPFCARVTAAVEPAVMELLALIFTALLAADLTLTVSALSGFDKKVLSFDKAFNERMTDAVESIYQTTGALHKQVLRRVKGFRYPKRSQELMQKLISRIKQR